MSIIGAVVIPRIPACVTSTQPVAPAVGEDQATCKYAIIEQHAVGCSKKEQSLRRGITAAG